MIKQLLKKNYIVRRLKAIKDLFLEKLDHLQSALEQQDNTQDQQNQQVLENQAFLLRFAVDAAKGLQNLLEFQQASQSYYQLVSNKLITLENKFQEQDGFIRETLGKIADDIHAQKFKVITDPSYFQAVDIELMVYLYSFLPCRRAIDIGANRGDVSARLLDTGYEVYAFEPFPMVLEKLRQRLGHYSTFHAFPYALGSTEETKDLYLATDSTEAKIYDDASLYSSLTLHSLAEGLSFTSSIPVTVRTLASLHQNQDIPDEIGLVKIDTEGYDLEVIKGMGNYCYPVVVAEFWDSACPFGQTEAMNHLKDLIPRMRAKGYGWHIVIYRVWGSHDLSYYCNANYSVENSWGNIFFFQEHKVFQLALQWCSAVMPATYFSV